MPDPAVRVNHCYTSKLVYEPCGKCGDQGGVVHIPTAQPGYFCEKCCPVCRSQSKK